MRGRDLTTRSSRETQRDEGAREEFETRLEAVSCRLTRRGTSDGDLAWICHRFMYYKALVVDPDDPEDPEYSSGEVWYAVSIAVGHSDLLDRIERSRDFYFAFMERFARLPPTTEEAIRRRAAAEEDAKQSFVADVYNLLGSIQEKLASVRILLGRGKDKQGVDQYFDVRAVATEGVDLKVTLFVWLCDEGPRPWAVCLGERSEYDVALTHSIWFWRDGEKHWRCFRHLDLQQLAATVCTRSQAELHADSQQFALSFDSRDPRVVQLAPVEPDGSPGALAAPDADAAAPVADGAQVDTSADCGDGDADMGRDDGTVEDDAMSPADDRVDLDVPDTYMEDSPGSLMTESTKPADGRAPPEPVVPGSSDALV